MSSSPTVLVVQLTNLLSSLRTRQKITTIHLHDWSLYGTDHLLHNQPSGIVTLSPPQRMKLTVTASLSLCMRDTINARKMVDLRQDSLALKVGMPTLNTNVRKNLRSI